MRFHSDKMNPFQHSVQFYETEQYLSSVVSDYLADGIESGESSIVIASPRNRELVAAGLESRGCDVAGSSGCKRIQMMDARETLDRIMSGNSPSPKRFAEVVGGAVEMVRHESRTSVRAFGEMVNILWQDGNREGAIELEELWNDLGKSSSFSLLCAYKISNFESEADARDFSRICSHHTSVIPTERYTWSDEGAQLVEVAMLQQRAAALEVEVIRRRALETELLKSLAERDALVERERSARAEAESASAAKSEFLAMMSHELRTPLNAIGGHIQLVLMELHGPVTKAQREALERADRSQQHLLSLITNVLNFARTESSEIAYHFEDVAVAPIISDVARLLEPLALASRLQCSVYLNDASGVRVRTDRERVHQILMNLVGNAIKFSPPGGSIVLETTLDDQAVTVHVRDTGPGIPAAKLERIFEPFVQLRSRPDSSREGLGLGLAISRDIARGMGGNLTVTSVLGAGTTLSLSLPRQNISA